MFFQLIHSFICCFSETSGGNRLNEVNENIRIDGLYGFYNVTDTKERTGFLINMHAVSIESIKKYDQLLCNYSLNCYIFFIDRNYGR